MVQAQPERVACVIPAYNEEPYIARVLDVICQVPDLSPIVVVDDASQDRTCGVVRLFCERDDRVHLVQSPTNCGKGAAMVAGAKASACDLLVFLDADLIGLRPEHVLALVEPVRTGTWDMTMAVFVGGRFWTDWSHRLVPFLSGQRCLRWSLFRSTPDLPTARYGVEVALSLYALSCRYEVMAVPWDGVSQVMKYEKVGWRRGWASYLSMYREIVGYLARCLAGRWRGTAKRGTQGQRPDMRTGKE